MFTLQGDRGSSTADFFLVSFTLSKNPPSTEDVRALSKLTCFVYVIKKSSEHNQRRPKIVEADVIRQKFQMRFELRIAIESRNSDVTITNRSQIAAESRSGNASVNGAKQLKNTKMSELWMFRLMNRPRQDF